MWIFIVLHCLICLLVYLFMRIGLLKSSRMIITLVILIPVFGLCCLIVLEWESRGNMEAKKEAGIEKLKINDEIHRSILMEEDSAGNLVVPLQEALIMNDASVRRQLMMDIMYDDTREYVDTLLEARMNDDTEVVHYATTAMVELQKKFDKELQIIEKRYNTEPDNSALLNSYLNLLEDYIGSRLLEGNTLLGMRRRYGMLLDKKIKLLKESGEDSRQLYEISAENELCLKNYNDAFGKINTIIEKWPLDEAGYLLLIKYYTMLKRREGIEQVLNLLGRKKIYLSPAGRKTVEFWQEDTEKYEEKPIGMEKREA